MAGAAECNKLAEVQYLYRQGCKWPEGLLESASESGYFELERCCYEHGCPLEGTFANEATRRAAQSGNVARMASLLQLPGIELHEGIMCWAATLGHKDMCKYLHEQQCPWDYVVTCRAAVNGHIELLRWLVDNGCPWDASDLCKIAVQRSSVELLMFLQQEGVLTSATMLSRMLREANTRQKHAAAQWLRQQGAC
eukprot:1680-Heterococcus_DN1.PRE.2